MFTYDAHANKGVTARTARLSPLAAVSDRTIPAMTRVVTLSTLLFSARDRVRKGYMRQKTMVTSTTNDAMLGNER